ncbi:hypothetical protein D2E25_1004 [Bifidobacterium goeldii]|uniref:LigA n=1 Tax=Bifidobacterium goeldii TaxID=2306975 RepID=A0A430FLR0_9BIFI|nr:hypothetical protein [Bifidobacterium goeldii]RSX53681.1 hypothetical protein D2E25_1004 [Bifidobacterium goeldii]
MAARGTSVDSQQTARGNRHGASRTRIGNAGLLLLAAALLLYSGSDLWQNIAWPPFFSFDETLEIDYVYQLTQGHLPTFFGGAEFNPLHLTYPFDVQWRYQHPPMFYALEVPIFLLFDTLHHPIRGIWAMRLLVWVMGVTLIVCSRWAGKWVIGRECLAVDLVPLIVAANRCLPSVVFNYTLASLWVTLLIGMTAKLVRTLASGAAGGRGGVTIPRGSLIAWWLIVIGAPLTRLSTIPIMALCLLIVFIAALAFGGSGRRRVRGVLMLDIIPGILAVCGSAWFYLRLHALSGNFTGSQPEWSSTHLQRDTHKSFIASLLSSEFYKSAMSQYHNAAVTATRFGWAFVLLLTIIPLAAGIIALIVWAVRSILGSVPRVAAHAKTQADSRAIERGQAIANLLMVVLLACAFGGTVLQQLLFYVQGGSANAVYFSLISIVFAIVIACGFTWLPSRRWVVRTVICAWLTLKIASLLYEAKLKWPFAPGGTMEHAAAFWQPMTWLALTVACAGVTIAIATVLLNRSNATAQTQ